MKRKSFILALLVFVISMLGVLPAMATVEKPDIIVSLQIDNPIMKINGNNTEIDVGAGTKPIVSNGRTLVPIRAIIEAFDGVVDWDDKTRTVSLKMEDDTIRLVIDSNIAYLNNSAITLDVAPTVINDRTMLPIRFIAEGFNLGVAWDDDTKTVSVIRNSFDSNEYNYLMSVVPPYIGNPYTVVNSNIPFFDDYEIINGSFEYYSDLDYLGRCDVCFSSIAEDIMPTDGRESISSVTPTGWINAVYENVDGGYLYNRCHLIGYQLTGENANERNLITGTRYLNIDGMLPFENAIADYIEKTGNRVMYRSTPVFKDNNLVADGVLLEAYSVEDKGAGLAFCVYCYNVQPQIEINYLTGSSSVLFDSEINVKDSAYTSVYRTPSGKKYHLDVDCGGKNSYEITFDEAKTAGLTPCKKCAQ